MIKKEQSWDLMITLNKEDYPVIVKAKPDGGFKVHYISFIVIFHVLVGSLAFVDWVHNFAHVFLLLAVAIMEFLWLYCTVGKLSILSGELSELQENAPASSEAVRDKQTPRTCISYRMRQSLDLSRLPQKKSLLPGYGFTSLGCHLCETLQWHVSRMDV